jgi:hypothetical protein
MIKMGKITEIRNTLVFSFPQSVEIEPLRITAMTCRHVNGL